MNTAIDGKRVREAGEWLMKLRDDELSGEQISGWLQWAQAHPDNLQAFEQMKLFMRDIKGLDAGRKAIALERLMPAMPAARRPWRGYAAAAAVLVAFGIGAYFVGKYFPGRELFEMNYVTLNAENRAFSLPDGTRVHLGGGSRLHVQFTSRTRNVELGEGEAFFETASDADRPFHVNAGAWRLNDIGTAFNVRKTNEHVVVTVTSGIVDLMPNAPAALTAGVAPVRLLAGEQIAIGEPQDQPRKLDHVALDQAVSWQYGQLTFADEPLPVVIGNLNRYSDREIILLDPRLDGLRFSGTVLTGNVTGWLEAACRVFNLGQYQNGSKIVLFPLDARGAAPMDLPVPAPVRAAPPAQFQLQ